MSVAARISRRHWLASAFDASPAGAMVESCSETVAIRRQLRRVLCRNGFLGGNA
jgi:hypothetical protein